MAEEITQIADTIHLYLFSS